MASAAKVQAAPASRSIQARATRHEESLARAIVPCLSVVIVNYDQWQETCRLTRQVLSSPAARAGLIEVVVVDNHSKTHPLCRRLRRWPGVSLRRWSRNRGFARAANEGCRLSRGRWLLLLNPDITLAPDFLDQALALTNRLSAQRSRAGIIGCRLDNPGGSQQLSCGPFPTLVGTVLGLARPRSRRKYRLQAAERRCRVPWVTGCCLLLQRECLQQLGGFDEEFFLYYEDVDLCRRARALGWSVWYEPRLQAVHHRPLHSRPVPTNLRIVVRHAVLTYAAKHWPLWQLRLLGGLVWTEAWLRQHHAEWQGNGVAAQHFAQLRGIAIDIAQQAARTAQRRLRRLLRYEERLVAS